MMYNEDAYERLPKDVVKLVDEYGTGVVTGE